jgi:hypothetical protein
MHLPPSGAPWLRFSRSLVRGWSEKNSGMPARAGGGRRESAAAKAARCKIGDTVRIDDAHQLANFHPTCEPRLALRQRVR